MNPENNDHDNLFRPMDAANTNPSSQPQRSNTPILLGVLIAFSLFSIVFQIIFNQEEPILAVLNIFPGVLIGFVVILLPSGDNLGWRKKYWLGFRVIMLLIALVYLVPFVVSRSALNWILGLTALPLAGFYIVERLRRRYRPEQLIDVDVDVDQDTTSDQSAD